MTMKAPVSQSTMPRAAYSRWGRRVPVLDAALGFALLRDRRVNRVQKMRALLTGGAAVAGVIAVTAVCARLLGLPGAALNVAADGFGLVSGTLLIGSLMLMRLAPVEVISRIQCERYRVIPLRKRAPAHTPAQQRPSNIDPLTALGYAEPRVIHEYAVIPCKER